MSTNPATQSVAVALRKAWVAEAQAMGFQGKFAMLIRKQAGAVTSLWIDFQKSGNAFCVHVGFASSEELQDARDYFNGSKALDLDEAILAQCRHSANLASPDGNEWFRIGAGYDPVDAALQALRSQLGPMLEHLSMEKQTIH